MAGARGHITEQTRKTVWKSLRTLARDAGGEPLLGCLPSTFHCPNRAPKQAGDLLLLQPEVPTHGKDIPLFFGQFASGDVKSSPAIQLFTRFLALGCVIYFRVHFTVGASVVRLMICSIGFRAAVFFSEIKQFPAYLCCRQTEEPRGIPWNGLPQSAVKPHSSILHDVVRLFPPAYRRKRSQHPVSDSTHPFARPDDEILMGSSIACRKALKSSDDL
jgi:hypothetical protein